MDKGRNLLPWILGGLSMATLAIGITVGWAKGIAPNNSPAPSQTAAHLLPDAEVTTAPAPTLTVTQIRPVTAPTAHNLEANHPIWECTINGVKTFSDNSCGAKASLVVIGPINGMDPTPVLPHARSYVQEPSGQPNYSYPSRQADSYPSDQQSAGNSYPADDSYPADNSYPVFVGVPIGERGRSEHEHRRDGRWQSHNRGPQPLRN
jgi:hypothetical protein